MSLELLKQETLAVQSPSLQETLDLPLAHPPSPELSLPLIDAETLYLESNTSRSSLFAEIAESKEESNVIPLDLAAPANACLPALPLFAELLLISAMCLRLAPDLTELAQSMDSKQEELDVENCLEWEMLPWKTLALDLMLHATDLHLSPSSLNLCHGRTSTSSHSMDSLALEEMLKEDLLAEMPIWTPSLLDKN
jgi:hypothetical protein